MSASRDEPQPAIEVMLRPPRFAAPAEPVPERQGGADVLSAVAASRHEATVLHRQYLALHGAIDERLASLSSAPAGTRSHSETEIRADAWYLDGGGRMAPGMIVHEALALLGQPPTRALDCEITFDDCPPGVGETLRSEVAVDPRGSAFRGWCESGGRRCLSLRGTWSPPSGELSPPLHSLHSGVPPAFGPDAVRASAEGRLADCFGGAWESTRAHVRSPHVGTARCMLLDEILTVDREHICARGSDAPAGHDMRVGLSLEGCLQAMAFQLSALGLTAERDGWRFEPVTGVPCALRWYGTPIGERQRLEYQVTVASLTEGRRPALHADAICTVDGQPVLRARGLRLRLVPDWPLSHWRKLGPPAAQRTGDPVPLSALGGLRGYRDDTPVAEVGQLRCDYATMLAAAWGPVREALDGRSVPADDDRRMPRLPGPPLLFVTRLTGLSGVPGAMQVGAQATAEYDVPDEVWFLEQNGTRTMPIAVLLEIASQPCGFLAAHVGSATVVDGDMRIRNLAGDLTLLRELPPDVTTLRTSVELIAVDRCDGALDETFRIRCLADRSTVLEGTLVLGVLPDTAFHPPAEMRVSDVERGRVEEPWDGAVVDLRSRPARYFGKPLRLPGSMLLMLDRITGWWPDGGPAGLGRLRAETDVRADAWYFKAHFFTDPVQPRSLAIEAMCQLLQFYLIERGVGIDLARPRFEPLVPNARLTWTMRGQVVPTDGRVTIEMDILEAESRASGGRAVAEAWLWVDGRRISHVPRLELRVVPDEPARRPAPAETETSLDPTADRWLVDHSPSWTVPVLPLMSVADLLARAASAYAGRDVVALRHVQLRRWLPLPGRERIRMKTCGDSDRLTVTLATWREAGSAAFSRFAPVATATAHFHAPPAPARFAPLTDARTVSDPYASAELFHGPSFQYLASCRMGASGSSGSLETSRGTVPRGLLHQGLLDAATHVIPHMSMWRWAPEIERGTVAVPHRLEALNVFQPLPDRGAIDVEARFAGFDGDDRRFVVVDVQMCSGDRVLVDFRLIVILLSLGYRGTVAPRERRAFARDRSYVAELLLSTSDGAETVLRDDDVQRIDHVPGSVGTLYDLPFGLRAADCGPLIAAKEHVARRMSVHPCTVELDEDLRTARCSGAVHRLEVTRDNETTRVRDRV